MVEGTNTQMAIDLLCCHLGITEEEAKKQIGILTPEVCLLYTSPSPRDED